MNREDLYKSIFAINILLARKWEVVANRSYNRDDLTVKQLLLLIVVQNSFKEPPTVSDVAKVLATSHQNVKALSLQLEKKGFLQLEKDELDKRTTRLKIKPGNEEYWKKRDEKDLKIITSLFSGVDMEELETTLKVINQLDERAKELINK